MSDEIEVKVNSYGEGRNLGLVYIDPISGIKKAKSAGTKDWGEAERRASELERQLRAGMPASPSKMTWKEFVDLVLTVKYADAPDTTRDAYRYALGHVTRVLKPDRLCKLTTPALARLVAELRKEGMKPTTMKRHLRHIATCLRWAVARGHLLVLPAIDMPKAPSKMKGRPITLEEFERMLAATPKVRPDDSARWERLLRGLWLSGLRIGEAMTISWDEGPFQLDTAGKRPVFRIQGAGQKSGRAEIAPTVPDFCEWVLAETPEGLRTGPVFPLPSDDTLVKKVVSAIGKRAGVVVDPDTGKCATAHDLRRSFGTRWAKRVMPAVLQRLMRHASIQTTMTYYVGLDADEIAADLWQNHGNTSGNTSPSSKGNGQKKRQRNHLPPR